MLFWPSQEAFRGLSVADKCEDKAGDPGPLELGSGTALEGFMISFFWNVCAPPCFPALLSLSLSWSPLFPFVFLLLFSRTLGHNLKKSTKGCLFFPLLYWKFWCWFCFMLCSNSIYLLVDLCPRKRQCMFLWVCKVFVYHTHILIWETLGGEIDWLNLSEMG